MGTALACDFSHSAVFSRRRIVMPDQTDYQGEQGAMSDDAAGVKAPRWLTTRLAIDMALILVSGGVAAVMGAYSAGQAVQKVTNKADFATKIAQEAKKIAAGVKQSHTKKINNLESTLDKRFDEIEKSQVRIEEGIKWMKAQQARDSIRMREEWRDWQQRQ